MISRLFNPDLKSMKLIRSKDKQTNQIKKLIGYTKNKSNTVYLPLVTEPEEVFNSIKYLLGTEGVKRSFYRYFYPKRFFYTSVLYPSPKYTGYIDEDSKKNLLKTNLVGFRGLPRNKIMDLRNVIVDYTDIINKVIPKDREFLIKPGVFNYIENIYPEFICYALFNNDKHEDIFENDDTINEIKSNEEFKYLDDVYPINEKNDENSKSLESFDEKLTKKTTIFSLNAPMKGFDKMGFNDFIVSIPIKIMNHKFLTEGFVSGKLPIQRNYKIDPNITYQISFIRFIYKYYNDFFNGSSNNQFINEMIKHKVVFYLYTENGIGIVIDPVELKIRKIKPTNFLKLYINRLKMMILYSLGTISDDDVDKIEIETTNKENDINTSVVKDPKMDIKTISEMKNITDNSDKMKISKILEDIFVNKNKKRVINIENPENILNLKESMNDFDKLTNKFISNISENDTYNIKSDNDDAKSVSFNDNELNDILSNTDEEEDVMIETEDEEVLEEETNNEDEVLLDTSSDDSESDSSIKNIEDNYGDFDNDEEKETEIEEEDDEEGYVKIEPKGSGPIVLKEEKRNFVSKLSPDQEKRLKLLENKFESLQLNGTPINDIIGESKNININNEKSDIKNIKMKDESLLKQRLMDYQTSYIKQNYQADIINSVRALSLNKDVPMVITKIDVEDTSTQFENKYTYSFILEDPLKKRHTVKFDVPKIDDNGFLYINGNKKYLKKQIIRNPIVKISPDTVYITTQLNSYMVQRVGAILNRGSIVILKLLNEYINEKPNVIIERGSCILGNKDYLTTLEYDFLAKNIYKIILNKNSKYGEHIEICFSQEKMREAINNNPDLKYEFSDKMLPIAINYTRKFVYEIDIETKGSVNSSIFSILNDTLKDENMLEFVKKIKTPKRRIYTRAKIQSRDIPLIAVLNFLFGWEKIKSYFPESEIEFSSTPIRKNKNKLFIKFYDGYLYYNEYPLAGSLLLNGLSEIGAENYTYESLNKEAMYVDYVERKFGTKNVIKGWITTKECMLDFKTLQILETLGLPTNVCEVFLYCNELLTDNHVKSESDISNYRIKGHELIAECVYKVLIDQYNEYKKRSGKKATLSIPQNAVMSKVYKTEILENYESINPVAEIKALSLATYKGPGGTKLDQAFTTRKRAYDKSYYGVFSMCTPDNGSTGVVKELTLNTKIENTLGFIGKQDMNNVRASDVSSVAESLIPYASRVDDPSRVSFISIQNNHLGGLENSSLPCVRTGAEKMIGHLAGNNFTYNAKEDGVVTEVDEVKKLIYITYKSGKKEVIDYKNKMLRNSDAFIEETYQIHVKPGQKIRKDDPIMSDSKFFKSDPLTGEVLYTQGVNAMIAIMEGFYTEDDSSLLNASFAEKLKMNFSKRKQICLKSTDNLISYKKIGDEVKLGDPLIVFDSSGALSEDFTDPEYDELFKDLDKDMLSTMIHQTPKANHNGTIKEIKVYWTCPVEKFSKSIRDFINQYINRIKKEIVEEEKYTGVKSDKRKLIDITITDKGRINGVVAEDKEGNVVIEYYISEDDIMSVGDKVTLHSALKSVNSTIVPRDREICRQNGKLDGVFSMISTNARMINSHWIVGFLGKLLYDFSKNWAKNFLKEIGE